MGVTHKVFPPLQLLPRLPDSQAPSAEQLFLHNALLRCLPALDSADYEVHPLRNRAKVESPLSYGWQIFFTA